MSITQFGLIPFEATVAVGGRVTFVNNDFNGQERKFRDFHAWESQNWLMVDAAHRAAGGTFRATAMTSLEPFTLHKIGSPQVFQTGETFRSAPLKGYIGADLVGSPTLGPAAFMHLPSAYGNPQAPLSHHFLDSTHITPGVVRGGVGAHGVGVEGVRRQAHTP